jgi:hypothetical protein
MTTHPAYKELSVMNVTSSIQRRFGRVAIALTLVALVILGSVAFAYASAPRALPVDLNGGPGYEDVLPVEPDGGIGGEIILPVEPDGGIGD